MLDRPKNSRKGRFPMAPGIAPLILLSSRYTFLRFVKFDIDDGRDDADEPVIEEEEHI
jgi:hypothetical protein